MKNNILIVDDTIVNRTLLKMALSRKLTEISIIEAEDGFGALELLENEKISVIILDIMMPKKDGIQVLKEIKANDKYKHIPIIIYSAVNAIDKIEEALKLGALDYFTKPLSDHQIRISLPIKIKNAINLYEYQLKLIEYNEHIQNELSLAQKLQRSIITEHISFENEEMWGQYIPCEKIGGDFFSCKNLNNRTWFIIADVTGHGVASAMLSTMISVFFDMSIKISEKPVDILKSLNNILCRVFKGYENSLVSAVVGLVDGNNLYISSSGHPYPVIYKKDKNFVELIEINGLLLGIKEEVEFDMVVKEFNKGDCIIVHTDGLIDKGSKYNLLDLNTIYNYCDINKESIFENVEEFSKKTIDYFRNLGEKEFNDDVALMIVLKK